MVLGYREQHGFERTFNRQGGTHVPKLEKRLLHDIFRLDNRFSYACKAKPYKESAYILYNVSNAS